jgi:ribose 5-phosphate isomerase B
MNNGEVKMVCVATDHAGFALKEVLVVHVKSLGYEVVDHGAREYKEGDDYPAYIAACAKEVSKRFSEEGVRGIVLGGSGQGEAIVANRFPYVRAVVYNGESVGAQRAGLDELRLSREHNDANILSLGARFLSEDEAKSAVETWLATPFSQDERHVRRIEQIEKVIQY